MKQQAEAVAQKAAEAVKHGATKAGEIATSTFEQTSRAVQRDPFTWLSLGGTAVVLLALLGLKVIGPRAGGPNRDVSGQPWPIWLLCAVFAVMGGPLVAGALVHAPGIGPTLLGVPTVDAAALQSLRGQGVTMLLAHTTTVLIAAFLLRLIAAGSPNAGLGFKPADLGLGLMCFVLAWPPVNAALLGSTELYAAIHDGARPPAASGHKLLSVFREQTSEPWTWVMMGSVILLGPIGEELVYRGLLQSAALRLTGRVWPSLLLTSAIFTAAHTPGGTVPWYALPALFVLSLGMGLAFERTGRLGVPIVMHMAFNALNVVLASRGQE